MYLILRRALPIIQGGLLLMPEYLYQHPATNEIKGVIQGVNDPHVYMENNIKWKRVFTAPQLNTVGTLDPFNKNQFINNTANTQGNYGDLMDRSRELSAQRAEKLGHDPVRNEYFDNYSKARRGIKHPDDKRKNKSKGYDVDY